jgi:hypothetical protein
MLLTTLSLAHSKSVSTTSLAPRQAAIIPVTPVPQPSSIIRFPLTISGL